MPQYIVVFKDTATEEEILACKTSINDNGGSVHTADFGSLMKGITADVPDDYVQTLQSFTSDGPIDFIEQDKEVRTQ